MNATMDEPGRGELRSALTWREAIAARLARRPPAVFLDFDGTLTPIVDDPASATLAASMRSTLAAVAERWPVAVVSGRDREDVAARVGLAELIYAGNHGFEIVVGDRRQTLAAAEAASPAIAAAVEQLGRELAGIAGLVIEHKRFGVAVHYRMVEGPAAVARVKAAVDAAAAATGLWSRAGKKIRELVPAVAWDKGRAVEWIVAALALDRSTRTLVYIGDDRTDEDALAILGEGDVGVRVGPPTVRSCAEYRLAGPDEVAELLAWLARSGRER